MSRDKSDPQPQKTENKEEDKTAAEQSGNNEVDTNAGPDAASGSIADASDEPTKAGS